METACHGVNLKRVGPVFISATTGRQAQNVDAERKRPAKSHLFTGSRRIDFMELKLQQHLTGITGSSRWAGDSHHRPDPCPSNSSERREVRDMQQQASRSLNRREVASGPMGSVQLAAWLNDRLFYRPDLQPCFRNLHKSGADLEYMLFVCKFLCVGDALRRHHGLTNQRGWVRQTWEEFERRVIKELTQVESCQTLETINNSIEMHKRIIAFIEAVQKFDEFLTSGGSDALTTVMVEFCYPPRFFNLKGGPGDRWGSFFLLVVTDHLRSNGKRKPNHGLAYRLLGTLRKDSSPIDNPRQSVATRIQQLKTAATPELCGTAVWVLSHLFREAPDYCKGFVDLAGSRHHLEFPALRSSEMLNRIPGPQSI